MRRALVCVAVIVIASRARAEGTFFVGAGYNPDEQFVASMGIAQDDLFHTGQKLRMDAAISMRRQRFAIDYAVPLGEGVELSTSLWNDLRLMPGFQRDSVGGSATLAARLDRATRVYVSYRLEQLRVTPELTDAARGGAASAIPLGDGRVGALGAGIEYDTTDGAIARRGTRAELHAEAADRALGSEYELWSTRASLVHARPIGPLTLRVGGHVAVVGADGVVPLAQRLFHDGHSDVRGYAIDPRDRGATFEATARAELEAPLFAGFSVAGFADVGREGDRFRRSVGASILWRSPIGPLRFDWALPLDGPDRKPQFLFWLGGGF